jgi:hypothetical protein
MTCRSQDPCLRTDRAFTASKNLKSPLKRHRSRRARDSKGLKKYPEKNARNSPGAEVFIAIAGFAVGKLSLLREPPALADKSPQAARSDCGLT